MRMIDTQLIEALRDTLAPFKTVTLVMSSESSSTASLIRPLHKQLMAICVDDSKDYYDSSLNEMKMTIHNDLDTRYVTFLFGGQL